MLRLYEIEDDVSLTALKPAAVKTISANLHIEPDHLIPTDQKNKRSLLEQIWKDDFVTIFHNMSEYETKKS